MEIMEKILEDVKVQGVKDFKNGIYKDDKVFITISDPNIRKKVFEYLHQQKACLYTIKHLVVV